VFDISELGLVEMTRKRIGEGLLTEFSTICPDCEGRGVVIDHSPTSSSTAVPRRPSSSASPTSSGPG
jgi:Ribonuclease G/E